MKVYVFYTVEESHVGVEHRVNMRAYDSEDKVKAAVDRWNDVWIGDGYADYDVLEVE